MTPLYGLLSRHALAVDERRMYTAFLAYLDERGKSGEAGAVSGLGAAAAQVAIAGLQTLKRHSDYILVKQYSRQLIRLPVNARAATTPALMRYAAQIERATRGERPLRRVSVKTVAGQLAREYPELRHLLE